MIRGLIHRIDLGDAKRGHEQRGRRYGVVLSSEDWNLCTVVPSSTSAQPSRFRPEVEILGERTKLLVDQIRSIDTQYLRGDPVGYLAYEDMARLDATIIRYLGLD